MGKTVSGVLAAVLGEPPGAPVPPADEAPAAALPQTGQGDRAPQPPTSEEPPVIDTAEPGSAEVVGAPDAPQLSSPEPEPQPEPVLPDPVPVEPVPAEPVPAEPVPAAPVPVEPVPADPVLAAAVDVALAAAREVAGASVGAHQGVEGDGPVVGGPVATHSFATTDPAYVGWRWAVTVARAEGGEHVTVDEVVLLPGQGALVAPAWVPWNERVRSGDLGPGDLLPPGPDDERLVPSYAAPDGPDAALADAVGVELGLGRPRVLSLEGRVDAADRWWSGDAGPDSPLAKQAPGSCVDCGFLVPLGGALRQAFGVCANGYAPDDGRVVALAHGCGAHSETVVDAAHASTAGMAVEDDEFELVPAHPDPAADGS